jgi:hypothetical protein
VYYKAADGSIPALEFLDACPGKIDAEFTAVLDAVAAAPSKSSTSLPLRSRRRSGAPRYS